MLTLKNPVIYRYSNALTHVQSTNKNEKLCTREATIKRKKAAEDFLVWLTSVAFMGNEKLLAYKTVTYFTYTKNVLHI